MSAAAMSLRTRWVLSWAALLVTCAVNVPGIVAIARGLTVSPVTCDGFGDAGWNILFLILPLQIPLLVLLIGDFEYKRPGFKTRIAMILSPVLSFVIYWVASSFCLLLHPA